METVTRTLAWARAGASVKGASSSAEALERAGLDWEVELQSLYYPEQVEHGQGEWYSVPAFATIRKDTGDFLGVVRDRYRVLQNREAFDFLDTLVAGSELELCSAGTLRGGRSVFVAARAPGTWEVCGDVFDTYVVLRTTHDGSGAVSATAMPVRVVCTNGMAVTVPGAHQKWTVSHVGDPAAKLHEARRTMELAAGYREAFRSLLSRLPAVPVSLDRAEELTRAVAHERTGRRALESMVSGVRLALESSPTIRDEDRGNGWGYLNALTEWQDHVRPRRSADSAVHALLDGESARARDLAARLLLEEETNNKGDSQ